MYNKRINIEITPEQARQAHFENAVRYLNSKGNLYMICHKVDNVVRLEVKEIGVGIPAFTCLSDSIEDALTTWFEVECI